MIKERLLYIFVWFSQTLNVWIFVGHPDQTVSARAYVNREGLFWGLMYRAINTVVFWQEDHCRRSHIADLIIAKELRDGVERN